MGCRRNLLNTVNRPLNSLGVHLLPAADYRELRQTYNGVAWEKPAISTGHLAYLKSTNPRLQELRARYRGHPAAAHTQWNDEKLFERLRLEDFRGDNHYVYQTRYSPSVEKYYLTADYVSDNDRLQLFGLPVEDGMFGAYTLPYDGGITISRDLLDSVNEINFIYARHRPRCSIAPARYRGRIRTARASPCGVGPRHGNHVHRRGPCFDIPVRVLSEISWRR